MANLFGHLDTPSFFSEGCGAARGEFEPYVRAEESFGVHSPCSPDPVNIISCRNPDRDKYVEEVGGLDLNTVSVTQPEMDLPDVIPILDRGVFRWSEASISDSTVGVSLEDIFQSSPKKASGRLVLSKLHVQTNLLLRPVFKKKRVILFNSGRDVLIETLWQELKPLDFVNVVAAMGFQAVTGFNFSVFYGECPFGQALNLKKSLETVRLFHEAGVTVIPHVYFAHQHQADRWVAWLEACPTVTTITINAQFREAAAAEVLNLGLDYLLRKVDRQLRVILEGPDIRSLRSICMRYPDSIRVALKAPSIMAQFRQHYVSQNGILWKQFSPNLPKPDVLEVSVLNYRSYYSELRGTVTDIKGASTGRANRHPRKTGRVLSSGAHSRIN